MSDLHKVFGCGFDVNTIDTSVNEFDVLAPGDYPVLIEKAELKATKSGTGHLIGVVLIVLDGPGKGRLLFDNINIQNPSQKCEQIGTAHLAVLGKAIDELIIDNTDQLVNKVCIAKVKVDKNGKNAIQSYRAIELAPASLPSYPPQPANYQVKSNVPAASNPQANQGTLADSSNVPPWQKK